MYTAAQRRLHRRHTQQILDFMQAILLGADPATICRCMQAYIDGERLYPDYFLNWVRDVSEDKRDTHACAEQHYPYIPFSREMFILILARLTMQIKQAGIAMPQRFIDVGSGCGDKVFLAHKLGLFTHCTGIEYNAFSHEVAEKQLERVPSVSLVQGDAFSFDFSGFDFIYMYHPICDERNMLKLMRHVIKTMPRGGFVVEVLPFYVRDLVEVVPSPFLAAACDFRPFAVIHKQLDGSVVMCEYHYGKQHNTVSV